MPGFDKIDLPVSEHIKAQDNAAPINSMGKVKRKRKILTNRRLGIGGGILLLFVLFVTFFIALPGLATYKSAKATATQGKLFAAALKTQNIALAEQELGKTKISLADTQKKFGQLFILRYIPLANFYYNDGDHALKAGAKGLDSAEIVVKALGPYADVLGLKGQGSFVSGSAEDRIKTAVLTMGKLTPQIDDISKSLSLIKTDIDAINPNHYPEFIFGKKIKTQLSQVQTLTDQSVVFVNQARPLIKVLPSLLGEEKQKKYLVLFQNDKELRPTGGFLTAYAIFSVDKGVIRAEHSEDIYALDASISKKETAPRPILKYLPKVTQFNLRDSNLSPDFEESMKTFTEMYDRAGQKVEVDGIVALDTHVLVSIIKILDDNVSAGGLSFNTKNDPRCDCPQVIYSLEDNISRPVNYIKTDRKGLLGQLLSALLAKALSSSPKIYWGPLFQQMLTETNEKHVLFNLFDKDAQGGLQALNAAGKIREFNGDYLHINDSNFGGDKANLFVTQAVDNAYEIKSDGTIVKTLTLNYKNAHKPSDCNLERGGLCLNAELRDWLRIYVPKGSKMLDSKGSEVKMTTYDELGKTVFEGFLIVRPLGSSKFTISYQLPFKVTSGSVLPLMIQKQPGTNDNQYTITVNGREKDTFPLLTDKELTIKR
ncbi:hypothetical protein BH11PAT1_BH11PAT1_4080 [soil metagenome]